MMRNIRVLLLISLFFTGIFYEFAACILDIGLLFILCALVKQKGEFRIRWNMPFIYVLVLTVSVLLSCIWAVDSAMAFWGFLKLSPVLFFSLILLQLDESPDELLADLPWAGAVMTVLSFAGSWIPALESYFIVADRLAGFFQYPNTFAIFLLLGLVYLLFNRDMDVKTLLCAVILLAGIFLSGSRTVFVLTGLALISSIFIVREKKRRLCICLLTVCIVIAAAVLFTVSADGDVHLLSLSLTESTLLGRVLYWLDALPVIIKNPLGLGWMGYYFTQGSFQTGVYSVVYAHNEFLQTFLDAGWVAGLLLIGLFLYGIKNADSAWKRMVLILLGLHCIMDFDLQFTAMYLVFLLLLPWEKGRQTEYRSSAIFPITAGVCSVVLAYFSVANIGYYIGSEALADNLPPQNTMRQIERLEQAKSPQAMQDIAEEILERNEAISLAWSAKAAAAFSQGDIENMIRCKKNAIALSRYNVEEYMDYLYMLSVSANMFKEAQDAASYSYCLQEILQTEKLLEQVKEETRPLAWKLRDKPELELPDEYQKIIDEAENLITDQGDNL